MHAKSCSVGHEVEPALPGWFVSNNHATADVASCVLNLPVWPVEGQIGTASIVHRKYLRMANPRYWATCCSTCSTLDACSNIQLDLISAHTAAKNNLRSWGGRTSASRGHNGPDMEVKPIHYRDISQRLEMQQVVDPKKRTIYCKSARFAEKLLNLGRLNLSSGKSVSTSPRAQICATNDGPGITTERMPKL